MTASRSPLVRFIQFLGKVKFTTVLLLGGALIMTVGTIVESREGREAAWTAVYGTLWFDIFLLLVAVNLVVAVINRIPIRRHHWPFVLTHFAIVLLLAGAWISATFGYEGQLVVYEGSEENRLLLDSMELRTRWLPATPDTGAQPAESRASEAAFPIPSTRRLAGRILQPEQGGRPQIRIAEYVESGVPLMQLAEAAPGGPPGIEFVVYRGAQQVAQWLIADDPVHGRIDLNAIEMEFRSAEPEDLQPAAPAAKPLVAILLAADGQLHVRVTDAAGRQPPAPIAVGGDVALQGLGLGLHLKRRIESARAELGVAPAPRGPAEGRQDGSPFLRVEASLRGERQSLWLERGARSRFAHFQGLGNLEMAFGPRMRPLPFSIALEEFQVVHHPGSSRPAEYWSQVKVVPAAPGLAAREARISMNRPLDVAGFRLFQSSYRLGRGGSPDATILTVSYDPGVTVVYVSFVLVILGIAWGLRGVRPLAERAAQAEPTSPQARRAPGPQPPDRRSRGRQARHSGLRTPMGLLLLAGVGLAPALAQRAVADPLAGAVEATRGWAILADGRVKPLLTFANENVLAITGRQSFDGLSALEILWGYTFASSDFIRRPYLRVDSLDLKAELGLDAQTRRFSFNALMNSSRLRSLMDRVWQRQRQGLELTRLERDAADAYDKLGRVAGLISGEALTLVPLPDASGGWRSIQTLPDAQEPALKTLHEGFSRLADAYAIQDAAAFEREARELGAALRALDPAVYPSVAQIDRELFYQDFNAFGKAWKLYLVGFLLVMLLGFSERPWGYVAGTLLIVAGFACHTIGVGTRWLIAGRAPVSDMYESLVFMGWGAIAFGLAAQAVYRKRFIALSSGLLGFLCVSFAENLPIDAAINPLVPVLAHTSWLSIHVMTIMLSYSALALAMMLGHVGLFVAVFQRRNVALASSVSKILHRTLQVGLLFLAAGIIFGAIWANESWGRYWGWDPKETWSLITLFVYLAVIHARFAGWLGNFGLSATAVLSFLAVLMTYYGVNFVLASGLHSYGFSEGGQIYAGLYAVAEIAIVAGAYLRYRAQSGPGHLELPLGGARSSSERESVS